MLKQVIKGQMSKLVLLTFYLNHPNHLNLHKTSEISTIFIFDPPRHLTKLILRINHIISPSILFQSNLTCTTILCYCGTSGTLLCTTLLWYFCFNLLHSLLPYLYPIIYHIQVYLDHPQFITLNCLSLSII